MKYKTARPHQHFPFHSNLSKMYYEASYSTVNPYSRHCHCPYSHLSLVISLVPAAVKCIPVLVLRLHISRVVASVSAVGKQLLRRIAADHLPLASIAQVLPLSFSLRSCRANHVLFVLALGIESPILPPLSNYQYLSCFESALLELLKPETVWVSNATPERVCRCASAPAQPAPVPGPFSPVSLGLPVFSLYSSPHPVHSRLFPKSVSHRLVVRSPHNMQLTAPCSRPPKATRYTTWPLKATRTRPLKATRTRPLTGNTY